MDDVKLKIAPKWAERAAKKFDEGDAPDVGPYKPTTAYFRRAMAATFVAESPLQEARELAEMVKEKLQHMSWCRALTADFGLGCDCGAKERHEKAEDLLKKLEE